MQKLFLILSEIVFIYYNIYCIIIIYNIIFLFYHIFFFAITSYICQCFITPNAVFLSSSISLKWIISKSLNNSNTSVFDKNTILGFISTHESFVPKKFPTKYPSFFYTFFNFAPKLFKIFLTTKRDTIVRNY